MSLARRDRAALALALECLRGRSPLRVAQDALCFTDGSPYLPPIIHECLYHSGVGSRLLRARLALLLRAVLRRDAIERDPDEWWPLFAMRTRVSCGGCGEVLTCYATGEETTGPCPRTGKPERAKLSTPLWQLASAHRP